MDFFKLVFRLMLRLVDVSSEIWCAIAGVMAGVMAILVTAAVVARYVFNYGILFAHEYAVYLFLAVGFLAAPQAMRMKTHPRVDIITTYLPRRVQELLTLIGYTFGLGFLTLFLKDSIALVLVSLKFGSAALEPTATPLAYPQLIMPIGIFFFILQLIIQIGKSARSLFEG